MTTALPTPATIPDGDIEFAPRGRIAALQLDRLRWPLRHACQRIGVTVSVEVLAPDTIERSLGKVRRLIDNRPH
ncbi:hypothetical protein ACQP1O_16560 [Nocardia sp. CA-151230]|uniref:hypothetical protein n=1 Tax=Nocardia sp. CA-151230 TaxID=3239982 RepID=UPI003D8F02D0